MIITGDTLIAWGHKPGKQFQHLLIVAEDELTAGKSLEEIRTILAEMKPAEPVAPPPPDPMLEYGIVGRPFGLFLGAPETDDELDNMIGVAKHMEAIMRMPVVKKAAVMPDACPSGAEPGTIPVGGVVASSEIHPGMHSADVCCSMAITVFKRDMDVSKVLDLAMLATHFGTGKSNRSLAENAEALAPLLPRFEQNPFLKDLTGTAIGQLGTQGDGNHFFYVGHLASTGELAIVTHHGSRNVGRQLYKKGMAVAQRHTSIVSPRTPKHNAWIKADSQDGEDYWDALQVVREWTKLNHFSIHATMQRILGNKIVGQFWNEHNFVFRRTDGLFYHAKGSTPAFAGFSADDIGRTLIPMNMGQPILITEPHPKAPAGALEFSPHGAGRLLSRTSHIKRLEAEFGADRRGLSPNNIEAIIARETKGIDARFYVGYPDVSELPSAYKDPKKVISTIVDNHLAYIVDTVLPGGSIMAGEMPWNRGKKPKSTIPFTDKGFQTGL